MPARAGLPAWLRTMPARAWSDLHGAEVRTVKQCPPFVDAMTHGFLIPLPCDVTVADGRLSWDWDLPPLSVKAHPRSPVSFFVPEQISGTPFPRDSAIVKFNSFWTVALEEGWSLFATHPVNRNDLPFRTLTGLVDSDRFTDVGVLFPALWVDPGFAGVLPRGTPVAQCFPVPRTPLDMQFEALDPAKRELYEDTANKLLSEPGVYRRDFRAKRSRSAGEAAAERDEIEP